MLPAWAWGLMVIGGLLVIGYLFLYSLTRGLPFFWRF